MANYSNSTDIINAALFDCGEATDGTSDYNSAALTFLNRGYQMIWMGGSEIDQTLREEWLWLRSTSPGVIIMNPSLTGSVTVTNNNATITFNSAPTISVVGYFFKTDSDPDLFRITAHTANQTTAMLDSVYTGVTSAIEGYKVFQTDYDLPTDILRIISPMRVYRDNWNFVSGVETAQLEQRWPLSLIQFGVPRNYAPLSPTKVRFSHSGFVTANDYLRVDFDYLQRPSDLTDATTSIPLLPLEYRHLLADYIAFRIMLAKNDNRSDGLGLMFKAGVMAMARENRHRIKVQGMESGHIYPRTADAPGNTDIVRTESGQIIG